MPSQFARNESRGRRQPAMHHRTTSAASHRANDTANPFNTQKGILGKQFNTGMPGLKIYVRNPITRQYRNYMRVKTPYKRY